MGDLFGGGGSNNQTVTQEWKPGDWIQPYLTGETPGLMETFQQYRDNPQSMVYQGPRVAGPNDTQMYYGNQLGAYIANNPYSQGLMNQWNGTMNGQFAQHGEYNPYESASNPYGGLDSPYFQSQLAQGQQDITKNYQQAIAPQLMSQQVRSGAYGSALGNEQQGMADRQLADSLARYTSGMQQDQYNRSAGLASEDINRAAGLREGQLGRENTNYENERNRQLQMMGIFPQLNQSTLNNYQAGLSFGDFLQSNQQRYLDQQLQYFNEMAGAPADSANQYINAMQALGGLGRAGVSTSSPVGSSPLANVAGLGALGLAMGK